MGASIQGTVVCFGTARAEVQIEALWPRLSGQPKYGNGQDHRSPTGLQLASFAKHAKDARYSV
jgi:hypothetical protein